MLCRSIFLLSIFLTGFGESYRLLLFFPFPGKSHYILGEALIKYLLEAGHEITYVTRSPIKDPPPRLQQINITSEFNMRVTPNMVMYTPSAKINKAQATKQLHSTMLKLAKGALTDADVQNLIMDEKYQFDAVIAEWMFNELYAGFSAVFNCPLIWSSTMIPHPLILSAVGWQTNPAYALDFSSRNSLPMTFWMRMDELCSLLHSKFYQWRMSSMAEEIYTAAFKSAVEKRGRVLPSYNDIKYNASLILGNSHFSTSDGSPLPANYVSIGGYHIDGTVKPLPQDLQEIMDNATNGVIYFSMGSLLTSTDFPITVKQSFADMFSTLNYTVLWKLDEDIPNLPTNVHNVKWAPQQSVLAHPNCILFITHGGLLSVTEAIHYGVPLIGLPVFGDQYNNMNRAAAKGFGISVLFGYDATPRVKEAIEEIAKNPSYRKRAKEMSFVYHHRLVLPSQELVFWVEHVIKTGGAPHLRSPGFHLSWYQKTYLDLFAVSIGVLVLLYGLIRYALSRWYREVKKLKFL